MGVKPRVLHFAQGDDTSGFFPQLARWHDRGQFRMFFGTLNPMAPWLRTTMQDQDVSTFSCECPGRWAYPLGLVRLVWFLRRQRIDILHTHLFDPSVIGLLSSFVARTPLRVMTRHYSDYHTRIFKQWHVRLDQLCLRLTHRVIAVSRHTAEHLVSVEGAPRSKIRVILNGIDFDRVKLSSSDAPVRVRRELGAEGRPLVVVAARLHPEKGYEHLFEAWAAVQARLPQPALLAVAGGGALEPHYRALVRTLGIESGVRFLGFRRDVPDLLAAADIVVLPSVAEAFGLALAEALYLGVPVVATRVGGIPEIVDDGIDGILVPPANAAALADAIVALLNDASLLGALAGRGQAKVLSRFSFQDMMRAYEAVYAESAPGRA